MARIRLNTIYSPGVPAGQQENHYGVPFTATPSGKNDPRGNAILVLEADLPDDEAKLMEDVDRVTILSLDSDKEVTAAPAAKAPAADAAKAPAADADKAPAAPAAPAAETK